MSLINKVVAIIDNKVPLAELKYSTPFVYEEGDGILNIKWKQIIPPPPKNDSLTTLKELDLVEEVANKRSQRAIELVTKVDKDPLSLFFDFFEKKNIKLKRSLFDEYYNIIEGYMYALKYYFNRPRPEQIAPYHNKEINVLYTETHQTPAYPSGHTIYAELAAHVFSDIYPQYKSELFEIAKQAGLARILQGVHFPSDNKASVIVAKKLYPIIKERLKNEQRTKEIQIDKRTGDQRA